MQETIDRAEQNIRQALADYRRYTGQTEVLDNVSDEFITRLAKDSAYAKQELRELFSKSPVWNDELDALIINGTRTHDPDYVRVKELAERILYDAMCGTGDGNKYILFQKAIRLFCEPDLPEEDKQLSILAINELAPKAYAPNKKLSRVFKALCQAVGVVDETAGSEFQRLFAQFADELTARKLGFKLFVSINPTHFLTMSNPKYDRRGNCLTSCHSLNSTEYQYNNGCSGYARDKVTFIVFTVDDPTDEETLNNRKTTRQIFAYRPGSGLLMQSRMYNTSGGVYGAAEDSKLYRDLVQREISALEGVPNLWKTYSATKGGKCLLVEQGDGFGGYADWTYDNFDSHISLRADCDEETVEPLQVGTWGLCVACGEETSHGIYCEDCENEYDSDRCMCDDCEDYYDVDDLYTVYDTEGEERRVCESCRNDNYIYCDHCGNYHADSVMTDVVGGNQVCQCCLDRYYEECDDCGEYYHPADGCYGVYDESGTRWFVCENCLDEYAECPHCGALVKVRGDGTCPHCGVVINDDKEVEIA